MRLEVVFITVLLLLQGAASGGGSVRVGPFGGGAVSDGTFGGGALALPPPNIDHSKCHIFTSCTAL
jgi:hypothetical protein